MSTLPTGSVPAPVTSTGGHPARAILPTVSWFIVSVPVLSEAMQVQDPSASTATSLRAMTLRRAIRRAPMERATVSATGRPSGMADTESATTRRSTSPPEAPRARSTAPMRRTAAPTTTAILLLNWRMRTRSGGAARSADATELAIWPSWVESPVATVTACARPWVTSVPANAMFDRSPRAVREASTPSARLVAGTDSPVRRDSSTSIGPPESSRASAGTLVPGSRITTSPGTISSDAISRSIPSRTTRARDTTRDWSAFALRWAPNSWMVPMVAFTIRTTRIRMVSDQDRVAAEMTAAPIRT